MPFINGIGPGEIIIILIIALIVVGPGKLPDVGSALGKSIREFRKAATDVKESTSLDAKPVSAAPAAPAPAQVAAPAAPVVTTPEPADAVPAVTAAPPVPALPAVPAAPSGALAASAAVETAANEVAADASDAAPDAGAWPAEVTPVDEQQPTASA
jgi:TatA/E family protein of Tat protein translocase